MSHAAGGGAIPLDFFACIHGSLVTVEVCNDKTGSNTMYRNNLTKVAHGHKN